MSKVIFLVGDKIAAERLVEKRKAEFTKRGIVAKYLDPTKEMAASIRELNLPREAHAVSFLGLQAPANQKNTSDWSLKEIIQYLSDEGVRSTLANFFGQQIGIGSMNVSSTLADNGYQILATTADEHVPMLLKDGVTYDLEKLSNIVQSPRTADKKNIKSMVFDVRDDNSSLSWFLDSAFRLNKNPEPVPETRANTVTPATTHIPKRVLDLDLHSLITANNPNAQSSLVSLLQSEKNESIRRIGGLAKFSKQLLKDFKEENLANSFAVTDSYHAGLASQLACMDGFKVRLITENGEVTAAAIYADYNTLINSNFNKEADPKAKKIEDTKSSFFRKYLRRTLNKMTQGLNSQIEGDSIIVLDAVCRKENKKDLGAILGDFNMRSNLYFLTAAESAEDLKKFETLVEHKESGLNLVSARERK